MSKTKTTTEPAAKTPPAPAPAVLLTREEHDILVTIAGRVAGRCGPGDGPTLMIAPALAGGHRVSVNTSSTRGGVACQTHHSFSPDGE